MSISSDPTSLDSFDPAIHLHSDALDVAVVPSSEFNPDDLDALLTQREDLSRAKTRAGIVIQHRTWKTADVLRSDDIFNPLTPSKSREEPANSSNFASSPPKPALHKTKMPFSSSPVLYPPSSSPPALPKKRKLFQSFPLEHTAKKTKVVGGCSEEEVTIAEANEIVTAAGDLPNPLVHSLLGDGPLPLNILDEEPSKSPTLPPILRPLLRRLPAKAVDLQTSNGQSLKIPLRTKAKGLSYEEIIAQRSVVATGRAKKSYYGVDIHQLIDDAKIQKELDEAQAEVEMQKAPIESVERAPHRSHNERKPSPQQMWTEKYRAKKFTELVGDERTHRLVLRWLKAWDEVVFPGNSKSKPRRVLENKDGDREDQHRKILLLTGPPGLGKTTLAHVCAKQAGYEVLEINASDDRSRDVVRGRIKDALGTETVRGIKEHGKARRAGRPVCVVVDEVDGVVTGSGGGGGEGGFMKALIDLVQLDQRNSSEADKNHSGKAGGKRKGDKFRFLRPLILICNDVYAPSLRPLRTSSVAEIVHVRRPPLDKVIARMRTVFEKENVGCDNDAVRRLCESSWGLGTRKQNSLGGRGAGEGDIRGVLVQGEWIAHKLRATHDGTSGARLTRKWIEEHLGQSQSSSNHKGLGRGGVREVVERIFLEAAGLPNLPATLSTDDARLVAESKTSAVGVADLRKRTAINALREMIDTCGEHDRMMTDCFATYPTQVFQDDVVLSKPNACYEWLYFHDALSSRIFSGQDWELSPYLSTSACGFHHLFAAVDKGSKGWNDDRKENEEPEAHPFGGLKGDFSAYEAEKQNRTVLTELQSSFSAPLLRLFSSVDAMATELMPNVSKILAPDVKPLIVGGSGGSASVASVRKESERNCVKNAVRVMGALNVSFEKVKIEIEGGGAHSHGGFAFRMEPPLDTLTAFHLDKSPGTVPAAAPVRYAVRQVLDQEYRKEKILQNSMIRQARSSSLFDANSTGEIHPNNNHDNDNDDDKENDGRGGGKRDILAVKGLPSLPAAAAAIAVKRDFFGRVIVNEARPMSSTAAAGNKSNNNLASGKTAANEQGGGGGRVWVSFHEGFSNAVRKPITLRELLETF